GPGVTLKFAGDRYNRPVFWLATGAVQINDSTLDLSGNDGTIGSTSLGVRQHVAVPGSGGYAGGAGGRGSPAVPATDGEGPGGGVAGAAGNCRGIPGPGFICGGGGVFTGNWFLVPLFGGSGGAGSVHPSLLFYGGGAGGGAILIASSTSITINGGT